MVFENGVKNIQAAAYNGARTVPTFRPTFFVRADIASFTVQYNKDYCIIHGTFEDGIKATF